ncbi:lipoyl(octanoyl) transferase LipB [Vandammella animalimorsus]|uniref:lipoyl(octanoyl) transferase LipB n=1 Tax=Vandammella animalimorsus TaxID=2029117 RepID=UPI00325AC382
MIVRHLGLVDYPPTAAAMQQWTAARTATQCDELWICQHRPVFTLGIAADTGHVLDAGAIPVVPTTRGGQVTYHGPGQIVAYPLVDLKRQGLFVKEYVTRLEAAIIGTLQAFGIAGHRVAGAPGVYVRPQAPGDPSPLPAQASGTPPTFHGLAKIAALGVKISQGRSYHGLALNVAMDLSPYQRINPCGYQALATTDMHTIGVLAHPQRVSATLVEQLRQQLQPLAEAPPHAHPS